MKRSLHIVTIMLVLSVALSACEYERMTWQESHKPYETKMPPVVPGAIPINGGEAQYRLAPSGSLINPIPASPDSIERGKVAYGYYCIQCHGSKYDGEGTVGQSFVPIPTDLMSPEVQAKTDDSLFRFISYGGDMSPPLAYTISVPDRWHIINWVHSLGVRSADTPSGASGDYPIK
jgi:mono/diheme cytochrome c family protein